MNQNSPHGLPCADCQTFIEEDIAGELDTATESAIASHLTTCESCQHEFRLAQAIEEVLDELPKPGSHSLLTVSSTMPAGKTHRKLSVLPMNAPKSLRRINLSLGSLTWTKLSMLLFTSTMICLTKLWRAKPKTKRESGEKTRSPSVLICFTHTSFLKEISSS